MNSKWHNAPRAPFGLGSREAAMKAAAGCVVSPGPYLVVDTYSAKGGYCGTRLDPTAGSGMSAERGRLEALAAAAAARGEPPPPEKVVVNLPASVGRQMNSAWRNSPSPTFGGGTREEAAKAAAGCVVSPGPYLVKDTYSAKGGYCGIKLDKDAGTGVTAERKRLVALQEKAAQAATRAAERRRSRARSGEGDGSDGGSGGGGGSGGSRTGGDAMGGGVGVDAVHVGGSLSTPRSNQERDVLHRPDATYDFRDFLPAPKGFEAAQEKARVAFIRNFNAKWGETGDELDFEQAKVEDRWE